MKIGVFAWASVLVAVSGDVAQPQSLSIQCIPALPFYCGNIHVGCAGRTRIETQAFTVSGTEVRFEDGGNWIVRVTKDRDARIHWREGARDWIRIESDGRFSLRRYTDGRAMMTRGRCAQVPDATR